MPYVIVPFRYYKTLLADLIYVGARLTRNRDNTEAMNTISHLVYVAR